MLFEPMQRRALVISGGGSKGAFAGGVCHYLLTESGRDYDILIGSSTGALILPFVALHTTDRLYNAYLSITPRDIFRVNPFLPKDDGTVGINHWNVVRMFTRGSPTFGDSTPLLRLIRRLFRPADYDKILHSGKDVIVCVSNLSLRQVEFKSIRDYSYDQFTEWMWASANFLPFMSLYVKDGHYYGDGGFTSYVPISRAIREGAHEVDAIILQPRRRDWQPRPITNPFTLLFELSDTMMHRIYRTDVKLGKLQAGAFDVPLRLFYTPYELTPNPLHFETEKMRQWWELGYETARRQIRSSDVAPHSL